VRWLARAVVVVIGAAATCYVFPVAALVALALLGALPALVVLAPDVERQPTA
jgi:hypothetical protein